MAIAGSSVLLCESAPATQLCKRAHGAVLFCYLSEKMNNKKEVRDAAPDAYFDLDSF